MGVIGQLLDAIDFGWGEVSILTPRAYFIHVEPGCTFGVLVAVYCALVAGYCVLAVLCCVLLGKSCGFGWIIWGQGMNRGSSIEAAFPIQLKS